MSEPNNAPSSGRPDEASQPAPQSAPQYQATQPPFYGQSNGGYTQQTANPYTQGNESAGQSSAPTAAVPLSQPHYGCSFGEAFVRFWKKYATFSGRASRSEFWWWFLASTVIGLVLAQFASGDSSLGFLSTIWWIATLIPTLALSVRRLHDTNKPGWWIGVYFGGFVVLGIAMVVILIVSAINTFTVNTFGQGATYYGYRYGHDATNIIGILAGGGIGIGICFLLMLALWITYIVFMALPSNPEGARFDHTDDAYTNQQTPNAGQPGYGQPTGYATPAQGAPASAAPNNGTTQQPWQGR